MITLAQAVDAISEYCDQFSTRVPPSTRDAWVKRLARMSVSVDIVIKGITRCAENDLGPSWSRLNQAIRIEQRSNSTEGLWQPEKIDPNDPVTPPEVASCCWVVIRKILAGELKNPKGDNSRWFWDEVVKIHQERNPI